MLDDYELLYLASDNNEDAIKEIIKKYYGLIHYKAVKYAKSCSDIDDFINEGILCLYEAIYNYTDLNNIKFATYLNTCLDCKMRNYKKLMNRKKHNILNNSISLNELHIEEDILIENSKFDPNNILLEKEEYDILHKNIINKLNSNEELVFILKEQNFTVKEISQIIDVKVVDIYNIIKSIRIKTNKIMSN